MCRAKKLSGVGNTEQSTKFLSITVARLRSRTTAAVGKKLAADELVPHGNNMLHGHCGEECH